MALFTLRYKRIPLAYSESEIELKFLEKNTFKLYYY